VRHLGSFPVIEQPWRRTRRGWGAQPDRYPGDRSDGTRRSGGGCAATGGPEPGSADPESWSSRAGGSAHARSSTGLDTEAASRDVVEPTPAPR